jgi:hypothetical protein
MFMKIAQFNRKFFDSDIDFTCIGSGEMGGKAKGLAFIKEKISSHFKNNTFKDINVSIPRLTVVLTDNFESFLQQNELHKIAYSDLPDNRIAHAFQKANLPVELLGDLRTLISNVHTPLAVRSSSLLEDAMLEPYAGIYATKMIPNNQLDTDTRFRKLVEAIKFVYASTFFKEAKNYRIATRHEIENEKMAVIIQEVVGRRHGDRFYPNLSGVARSYNFYPIGKAKPGEGIVNLALGLGKTIVDGGVCWPYSPAFPKVNPPYVSINELLRQTQKQFWAINMGKPPAYDPIKETEYLLKLDLEQAENDDTLRFIASTFDLQSDRIEPGTGSQGPRIITFSPLLVLEIMPFNEFIKSLLKRCEEAVGAPVEIEFAMTFDSGHSVPARFGFLQVRPMVVSNENVIIESEQMTGENVLLASESIMGNGSDDAIQDIVFVKPDKFEAKFTRVIAQHLEALNRSLVTTDTFYLLIGFGRWGSSDPWLGIPVNWSQVNGVKVIVEATLPNMHVELSQGSHFFHNLTCFKVRYFSVPHTGKYNIDWDWLNRQQTVAETEYIRHVKLQAPLDIRVDGRTGRGVVLYDD